MFYGCFSLISLDLSSWDTSRATGMYEMFYGCSLLAEIVVSESFDTSKAFPTNSDMWPESENMWWSESERVWLSVDEIQSSRRWVADTYRASIFRDVTQSTSHDDDILWLASAGVTTGWDMPAGKEFRPNNPVKRGDMAAFLHRLDGVK